MTVQEIAKRIDAQLLPSPGGSCREAASFFLSNTMSELIAHAAPDTLLVTALNNSQLVRVAELMDVPGICLVNGADPTPELRTLAGASATALLVSPHDPARTAALLSECLTVKAVRS
jgi:hypothetical protein